MNMYIGNLSYNVRESDLRDVMEEFGTVDSVKLIIDRDTKWDACHPDAEKGFTLELQE